MKYYVHHIRDFNNATRHLNRIERSIYRDMIELYYDTEQPLPKDIAILCRKIMANNEEEKTATLALLGEFFIETEEGWRHIRCDEDIAAASVKMNEDAARQENERERQARHRERRKELFARLREFDEVPSYDTKTETLQSLLDTHLSRVTSQLHTQDATANRTQNPEPRTHNPIEKQDATASVKFDPKKALLAEGVEEQKIVDFLQIRKAKRSPLTQTAFDSIKREAGKAGLSLSDAILLCVERGWQGFNASWLSPSDNTKRSTPSVNMRVNNLDHSSTSAAMAASMKRHGIVVSDNDDPIDF